MMNPKHGTDIDTDKLAQFCRALGDGIEDKSVYVRTLGESHDVDAEDASVMSFEITYVTDDSGLITPIEYTEDN